MSSVAVVSLNSLDICLIYSGPANQSASGGEWGDPNATVHLEVPEGLDARCVKAVRSDAGEITFVTDPTKVQAKTAQAWTALRTERNARLAASDWTALSDAHLSQDKKDAWFAYRQELRDLPDEVTDPMNVDWPLDPTQNPVAPQSGSRLSGLLNATI